VTLIAEIRGRQDAPKFIEAAGYGIRGERPVDEGYRGRASPDEIEVVFVLPTRTSQRIEGIVDEPPSTTALALLPSAGSRCS
jgi:hypothetical protein